MRCRCCDSPQAKFIHHYDEWYCEECLDSIEDVISEDEDLEELDEWPL